MSSRTPVQIHQKEPSISSYYSYSSDNSISGSSTPSSYSSSYSSDEYREYGATRHTSRMVHSGRNVVVNHGKVTYDPNASSPAYTGGYTRHS